MPHCDLIIRGGTAIDGAKAPASTPTSRCPRAASPRLRSGHRNLDTATAGQTNSAGGRIVAPGFIDSHTHDDQALLSQSNMAFKVSDGVAIVVAGNCGISAAPLRKDTDLRMPLNF